MASSEDASSDKLINADRKYIAYCGNDCTQCPQYRTSCPEGCLGTSCPEYCGLCEVRICGMEQGVINCGYCEEYPCAKLEKQYLKMEQEGFGDWAKSAKASLDGVSPKRNS